MANQLAEFIDGAQETFLINKPESMTFEAEKGFSMQILVNNPYLLKVAQGNKPSLMQAINNVAAIGLSLNPASKEAYLIPRGNKVYLEPSYMGLVKLATNSGSIKWVQAGYVCADDTFMDNGPGNNITHQYSAFGARGDIVGFYCVAKTNEGDFLVDTMSTDEINGIRDRSESWKRGQKGPWKTDYTEQAKKTVVRRAFKMWPKTDQNRMALAVDISNNNEGFEPIATSPNIQESTPDQKIYFDQLIESSNALGMFVLLECLGHSVQISLNRSFEHGSIGKYQKIVNKLKEDGRAIFLNTMTDMENAINTDDEASCIEMMAGLEQPEQELLYERLHHEYVTALKKIMENNNEKV